MTSRLCGAVLGAGLTLAAAVAPAAGQSLYNAAGLGVPVEALDGRARALGSLGIGLQGGSFMPTDPGALGRLAVSTGVMAAQPAWADYEVDGLTGSIQGTRFPLLGLAYPLLSGMMSLQIGSVLDQRYTATTTGVIDIGTGPIPRTDEFDQAGSISNVNIGFSRMLGERLSAGLTVGRYSGSVVRSLTRTYGDETEALEDVDPYEERGEWSYGAYSFTAGAAYDLGSSTRIAASIQVPSELDAEATEDTRGSDRSYHLPVQYRVGASVALGPALVVSGSAQLADWAPAQDDLVGSAYAGTTNGFGVGVELSRARLLGKAAPLRFGFRRTGLPFSFDEDGAIERVISGGFGLELSRAGDIVLASVDLAIERGRRSGVGLDEKFWRATISLLASGL
jgi:hypothetical protein